MWVLEAEARQVIAQLRSTVPTSKDDVRRVLLRLKREELLARREVLKTVEGRALRLLAQVDYARVEPMLVHLSPLDRLLWEYFRRIVSSCPWTQRVGRSNYLFCMDRRSGGVLGVMDIGSDIQAIGPRDKHIGWSREQKFHKRKLNHILNLGTCVSAHPFGILCGGKFMAMAATSSTLIDLWWRRHGSVAAAVATTSLYGRSSIYERLPAYVYLGNTPGVGCFHLDTAGHKLIQRFAKANGILARTNGTGFCGQSKLETLHKVCIALEVPLADIASHQPRGSYFAALGDQALPFLRGEIESFEPRRVPEQSLCEWWMDRWYRMRWPKMCEAIAGFDYRQYGVDAQIDLCADGLIPEDMSSGRKVAGGRSVPTDRAGSSPAVRSNT